MSAVLPASAMRRVTCAELKNLAAAYRPALYYAAAQCARETKIYLHWTAGRYGQFFADYHVQIDADGGIYVIGDGALDALLAATFLVGFAIAQLIWGPISDHVGRRIPLALGALLFLVGSIGCALSTSMEMVIAFRVVQAVGACVGPMLSRAMVRDLYTSSQAAAMLSTLVLIMAVAPIVAPLLGAFLMGIGGWRWIFWLMALIAVLLFLSVHFLPETLPAEKRSAESIGAAFRNYGRLVRMKPFMMNTLSVTFFYVAVYAFITESSVIYIRHFGVDPQYYGLLFGVNIIGVAAVSSLNRALVNRFSLAALLKAATSARPSSPSGCSWTA